MTLDEFLEIRRNGVIPIENLFIFYKECGGTLDNIKEFKEILSELSTNERVVKSSSGFFRKITRASVSANFIRYYEDKFNL